jgi:CubicO group peptidase (beta-lactamase class C family)
MRRMTVLCIALVACSAAAADRTKPLPMAAPQSAGFATARLDRVTSYLKAAIDQGQYAGAVTLVARRGRIVQWEGLGYRDVARNSRMHPDAIFQIYSMTKPITSVAALVLMEEGRLTLDDPVSRFIPQFASMQVLEGENAALARLRPAARQITIRHLLTHTSGFAIGEKLSGPAVERLLAARLHDSPSLEAYAVSLSSLPLASDPGTRFSYDGVSTEVLSRVIEVAAGVPFDEFLRTRVLVPLRMLDTGFTVPRDERNRIVEMTSTDESGRLVKAAAELNPAGERLKRYPSGAGGLYSTAADYARFCQMLLNGGELDGAHLLGRKTVELMLANNLTHLSPPVNEYSDAEGFGLGGYVVLDPARRGQLGSVGQFGWSGAAATWFTIDPHEQLIAILMMQHLPRRLPRDPPRLGRPFNNLVYQALTAEPAPTR